MVAIEAMEAESMALNPIREVVPSLQFDAHGCIALGSRGVPVNPQAMNALTTFR